MSEEPVEHPREDEQVEHPREDDGSGEVEGSPVPDPVEEPGDAEDDPQAD